MQRHTRKAAKTETGQSLSSICTEEWRQKYEKDGKVDLWMEDEFNAASRLPGGRPTMYGQAPGIGSGEGPSDAPRKKVKIINHYADQEIEIEVPVDRYVLYEAQSQGLDLPCSCRMGCCTACAVKVVEGELEQPQALGVSQQLKEKGYGLMCVGFPKTDLVLETVAEDEVYDLQFGQAFAQRAVDPYNKESIARDDFALELADMDE